MRVNPFLSATALFLAMSLGSWAQSPSPTPTSTPTPALTGSLSGTSLADSGTSSIVVIPAPAAATASASPSASPVAAASAAAPVKSVPSKQAPSLEKFAGPKSGKEKPRVDYIFSALVVATNGEIVTPLPPEMASLAPKLKTIFGYKNLELVGSHTELMDDPNECWLIPSKSFSLSIKSNREKNASYLLNLQLFQETKMLASFDAKLGTESPIVIRGPLCPKGQVVIVVIVK